MRRHGGRGGTARHQLNRVCLLGKPMSKRSLSSYCIIIIYNIKHKVNEGQVAGATGRTNKGATQTKQNKTDKTETKHNNYFLSFQFFMIYPSWPSCNRSISDRIRTERHTPESHSQRNKSYSYDTRALSGPPKDRRGSQRSCAHVDIYMFLKLCKLLGTGKHRVPAGWAF